MRFLVAAIMLTTALAGCSDSNTLLDRGACERLPDEGATGIVWECSNMRGAGSFTASITCADGFAGAEFEDGNGTMTVTVRHGNGTIDTADVEPNHEEFFYIGNNQTAKLIVRTSADFEAARAAFGAICFDFDF